MNNFSLLITALLEDVLLLLLLTILGLSGIEVLLPNLVLSRMPLALIIFFFLIMLTLYINKKEALASPLTLPNFPRFFWWLCGIVTLLVLLVSLRGFGLWAALVQITLLCTLGYLIFKK